MNAKVLYIERTTMGPDYKIELHTHSFWQMELITDGCFLAEIPGRQIRVSPGDIFIVPPLVKHGFVYSNAVSLISYKFSVDDFSGRFNAGLADRNPVNSGIQSALAELAQKDNAINNLAIVNTCAYLICSLIELNTSQKHTVNETSYRPLQRKIIDEIMSYRGRPVSIADLAGKLGYSASYISSRFKKSEKINLKNFIDMQRGVFARRFLEFSDLSIKQIAIEMDFPDQYTFSHFCIRTFGKSPRQIRKQAQSTREKKSPDGKHGKYKDMAE